VSWRDCRGGAYTAPVHVLWRLCLPIVALCGVAASGCAHRVVIETKPVGATVIVDDEVIGQSPVIIERSSWVGDSLAVKVQADNYETGFKSVAASEWFWWPALVALIPMAGLPFVVIPVIGPVITVAWAVVSSPSLLGLTLIRRFPEHVEITLKPRMGVGEVVLPLDVMNLPDEESPNPIPLEPKPPPLPPVR
jgi:hypothetical protein